MTNSISVSEGNETKFYIFDMGFAFHSAALCCVFIILAASIVVSLLSLASALQGLH